MECYVINLDRNSDRWNTFSNKNKSKSNIEFNRFPGIDGYQLKATPELYKLFEGNNFDYKCGQIGCALSHLSLMIQLYNSENDMYMILEDDIIILNDFDEKLKYVFDEMKDKEFDIIYLGHHTPNYHSKYVADTKPNIYKRGIKKSLISSIGGTYSYIITKKCVEKILTKYLMKEPITCPIDTYLQRLSNDLNIYYCEPFLTFSRCANRRYDIKKYNLDSLIQFNKKTVNNISSAKLEKDGVELKEVLVAFDEFSIDKCISYQ